VPNATTVINLDTRAWLRFADEYHSKERHNMRVGIETADQGAAW
jgi:hypothetical protein